MKRKFREILEEQGLKRPADAKEVYVEFTRKSRVGIQYTYYKTLIKKI